MREGSKVLIGSFLLLFVIYGSTLSFGVFLKPLAMAFGWKRALISGALSVSVALSGLVSVLSGRLTDKGGYMVSLAVGVAVAALSLWRLASLGSEEELFMLLGVGMGIATGCCYTPVNTLISLTFPRERALALGIALCGITVGQMCLSPIVAHLIGRQGWGVAFKFLSLLVLLVGLPSLWLLKTSPHSSEPHKDKGKGVLTGSSFKEAVSRGVFWTLMFIGFVLSAGSYFLTAHIVAFATDIGIEPQTAAFLLTVMGIGGIVGNLSAGFMARKWGFKKSLAFLFFGQAVILLVLGMGIPRGALFPLMGLFGLCFSAAIPLRTALVPRLFGTAIAGTIIGMSSASWAVGGALGPFLAGWAFDLWNSYRTAFLLGGILFLLGGLNVTMADVKDHCGTS